MWHSNNNTTPFHSTQLICYLFTCKLNILDANYKVSTSKKAKKKQQQKTYKQNIKQGNLYNNNNNIKIIKVMAKRREK
jgi:hypothetical protein